MVNLLSNDVTRFEITSGLVGLHFLWIGPIQLLIILLILFQNIGFASLTGGTLITAFIPLLGIHSKIELYLLEVFLSFQSIGWFGTQFSKFRSESAFKTDERIRLMNEIIYGIEVIKMYAWEYSFAKMIQDARR